MIELTVEEALKIQERQVKFYGPNYPGGEEALRAKVQSMTRADEFAPGVPYPVVEINKHIPRGGAIEALVYPKK